MNYTNKNWIIFIVMIITQFIPGYNQSSWAKGKESNTPRIDKRDYFIGLVPKYSEISANICCEDEKIFRNYKQQPEEYVVNYVIRMRRGDKIKVFDWPAKSYTQYECNDNYAKKCWSRVVMYETDTDLKSIALTYYCDGIGMKANISDPTKAYVPVGVISGQPRVDGAEPDKPIWCMQKENIASIDSKQNPKGQKKADQKSVKKTESSSIDNQHFADSNENK